MSSLDAIGFRACGLLCEHGHSVTASVRFDRMTSEVTIHETNGPWSIGAMDLATAVQIAARRCDCLDVVRWIDAQREALARAPTIPAPGDVVRVTRTG